jgi:hypothetical protein
VWAREFTSNFGREEAAPPAGVIRAPTNPLQTAKGEKFSPWLDKTCNQQKVEMSEETPNFNVDPDSCIGTPPETIPVLCLLKCTNE